jgi:hypothetical protein
MKKSSSWFYTPEQEKRMLEIHKTSKNQLQASIVIAKEMKKSVGSVQVKLSKLLKLGSSVRKQRVEKGVNIPKGFTFDIKPSKAVMFSDHVRLYF